jgi:hypothetical protein
MVAAVRNIETNDFQGVHRTALNPDGTPVKIDGKTARLALGSTTNGAVKLTDDADVTTGLFVGEGIETTIAGMMLPRWWRPAWALLYEANIRSFPVLAGIEHLGILVDHDRQDKHGRRAGEAAAKECTERWVTAGREVTSLISTVEGEDIADVACGGPWAARPRACHRLAATCPAPARFANVKAQVQAEAAAANPKHISHGERAQ